MPLTPLAIFSLVREGYVSYTFGGRNKLFAFVTLLNFLLLVYYLSISLFKASFQNCTTCTMSIVHLTEFGRMCYLLWCFSEANQEKIVEAGGLGSLLNLLQSSEDETIRRVAAGAVANLAMNGDSPIFILSLSLPIQ